MNKLNDIYLQWTIQIPEGDGRDILIGQLGEMGIEGFFEEAAFFTASGLKEAVSQEEVTAFLQEQGVSFKLEEVAQQNWNATWESSFEPVLVDDFAAVRAGFHDSVKSVQHEIVITPKMSFGTGHHATTWLCLQAMREIDFAGKSVIDFGTGTGVLSILAAKLGAKEVLAIDNDEWSITNAMENIAVNGVVNVDLRLAENLQEAKPADIMLANINRHIILAHITEIRQKVVSGGHCLLSGLLVEDREEMIQQMSSQGFDLLRFSEKNGWISLLFSYTASYVNSSED